MSDKIKITFKRTKEDKQVTEAFVDGEKVATITGHRKAGVRRVLLSMFKYGVDFVHDEDNGYWTSHYENAKAVVRREMSKHLNKETM